MTTQAEHTARAIRYAKDEIKKAERRAAEAKAIANDTARPADDRAEFRAIAKFWRSMGHSYADSLQALLTEFNVNATDYLLGK